ncbi:2-epi-5-epi-valiolone synthase [Rhodococcus sp. 15-725-2-2b]|uniref:sedoheptulose 7-phosphate cyclase n=1 Tax=unclassified Rhodococcus (in: high G+C Gram-positive bacteria) TaxID=192944 RepID=UPI000B9A9243|nr:MULTISPECIES: sedoheptulose 7-phosphate cyclase [unclassified Rhodococcus (in: high G+C Gram-positive bacteria)]OZC67409.1 2-epi-5-epi-valiolone synthase [Rhodococcus sp. 06-469-3-2]OZD49387.1 2-epi-5-epi-valiolone synthase [Rhodococcus sp. 06-1477-1A]OZE71870.1 2-epi-5-epi-valiolone synthase [Rhodococcus sp. 15-725-2-2b]
MRSAASFKLGLSHSADTDSAWKVEAVKQVEYHVIAARNLFETENAQLLTGCSAAPLTRGDRRLVVIDSNVDRIHGDRIRRYFEHHGVAASFVPMRADETVKEWSSVIRVVDAMNGFGIDRRREPVIAVGGGVLLDVVGFAASVYRRGTPYIRIPTTLIGLVDAGVGVKTGVNYGMGKNRLGTYAPAIATYVDRSFLRTLDDRHLSNGLAEILKMALIKSVDLFELLETYGQRLIADNFQGTSSELDTAATQVIAESIHLMLEELQPNLWESCLERCVDYGHTFSPTLEMEALPALLHGEAVSIDMALTSALGFLRGSLSREDLDRILTVMKRLGLPVWNDVLATAGVLDAALADTVRHRDGRQRLPLPVGIGGHHFANDVTNEEIASALTLLARKNTGLANGEVSVTKVAS